MIRKIITDATIKGLSIAALGVALISYTPGRLSAQTSVGMLMTGSAIGAAWGVSRAEQAVDDLQRDLTT